MTEPRLGAHWDGDGVAFALFTAHATAVRLALVDGDGQQGELVELARDASAPDVWGARVPGVRPGQRYYYFVDGPAKDGAGHCFDGSLPLLDPYARAIGGRVDAATPAPAVVVDPAFAWRDDAPPRTPWDRTLLYEAHVKGLTARHPEVPRKQRGTYLGLAHPAVLDHLLSLGVTAIELMPVHHHMTERHLTRRGRTNYWGYSTIGFFAPDARFASGADGRQVTEFKQMVRALHRAGLEVVLDVVYNHTGEGGIDGPVRSFRGIDNASYYRADRSGRYEDVTGCGNTLDLRHARVRQLVLDSMRYWVEEMHVDGFRFDLAPALARGDDGFDPSAPLFEAMRADPVLAEVKWIAEPWDLGEDGYRLGQFPRGWVEWNGRFRDDVRRFWRGDSGARRDCAARLSGSRDLFPIESRGEFASVHYVACHDGFTLADVVAYADKHNEANGEANRDGSDHNFSSGHGAEGATDDPAILARRSAVQHSLLAAVAWTPGVPMLCAGDELGRTQGGNNNAYCIDDARTWIDWQLDARRSALLAWTVEVLRARRAEPLLRGAGAVSFWTADGQPMDESVWQDDDARWLLMVAGGDGADAVAVMCNAATRAVRLVLPPGPQESGRWRVQCAAPAIEVARLAAGMTLELGAHGCALLRWESP